ncbi:NAD(P)H-hydrate epimerase [Niabella ginsenosidivorans]|uniref:Bifunctional NAD(P)H-hydrate repair enzyme n=1 Tax=Niabella ginsenosidivorans TaxID=1176587 RepID=A0A1A9I4U9_9BACT|nr:bifunctional ADP-dependent NAD(P)H-hydrate dehydratase/NAD(P)H-hydrate epimerase [Niabella ginsenosidivorans]ANH81584.1 NAD(P)H-hydrate epimerase [Niabella ginsenosidivorans]
MKLFSAEQIRQWDAFTIKNEPVSSLELMERAANACTRWIVKNTLADSYCIFCGKGNNGGDGLAIARLLYNANKTVTVFILESATGGSDDFNSNFNILHHLSAIPVYSIRSEKELPQLPPDCIIIDALFGTGLNRRLTGLAATLVEHINSFRMPVIAIDMPSGLFCDQSSLGNPIIKASHTLTFQVPKLAFLVAENADFFGQVHIMDINLHPGFSEKTPAKFHITDSSLIRSIYQPRKTFAHKGNFGHALIIAGSTGKTGAAVLSTRACLKTGAGLVSAHIPRQSLPIIQMAAPEAMAFPDAEDHYITRMDYEPDDFSSIGMGPGIGKELKTRFLLRELLEKIKKPLVLDADALNIIAATKGYLKLIPSKTIITPHPKEFSRLFGDTANDFEKIELASSKSMEMNIIIALKGHNTFIAHPNGAGYFNHTGNAGMAKGGSGDVLTGMITSLLAQGYTPEQSAVYGVYLHGLAGDLAARDRGMESMIASDIIEHIGNAFKQL